MSILERETAMNKDYGWPGAGHGDQDARYLGLRGRRRQPTDPSGRPQPGEGGLQYGGGSDRRGPTTPPTNTRRLLDKTSAEILKQRKQQRMASEDIELWQQRKLEKDIELAEEKKRDLEMLKGYKPWGKPSGGAPRLLESGSVDAKHRGLHWENHDSNSPEDENFPFGRSGGGAPRKSDSGRIITTLQKDPNTRFQKHLRNEVDNTLRYSKENVPSSQGDLGQPPGARRRHLNPLCVEQDDEKHKRALKYSRKLEEQILEQRERKLKEMAERTKAQKVYDPFGRDIPERDSSGNIVRRAQKPRGNQDEEDVGRGNRPSAFPFGSHNLVHKKVQNIKDKAFDDTDGYDPWGRPGGGAPIKDNAGNRLANRTGALEREKNSATTLLRKSQERRAYLDSLRNGTKQQNHSQLSHSESAGVEVASWIRSGVVGNPPMDPQTGEFRGANRTITDVVTNKLAIRRQAGEESQQYYKDLQHQAQERHENRLREKEKDKEMTRKHLDTLSKMWESPRKKHQQAESRAPLGMDIKLKEERQRYHEELIQQRQLQDEARVRQNQREIEEEQRHIETYNQQWGRPGCGAPNKTTLGQHKYKSVLDPSGNILRRRS